MYDFHVALLVVVKLTLPTFGLLSLLGCLSPVATKFIYNIKLV